MNICCVGKNTIYLWINFGKYSRSTTIQEHKNLRGIHFSLEGKTKVQTLNNFTHYCLSHCVSPTIFSYSLNFSLLFCLLSLTQFFRLLGLLRFSLPQITINASHLLWFYFNQNLFCPFSLAEWPLLEKACGLDPRCSAPNMLNFQINHFL